MTVHRLHPRGIPAPDAGPLLDAAAGAKKNGGVKPPSEAWVKRVVAGKIRLSYTIVRWYEADVDRWIAERARVSA